jgi:ligand-binding SRPBCC domain-containing protein
VFSFFGNARNLQAITPEWLEFSIVTPDPIDMRPGTLIDYKLRVHGVPLRWQTEITAWSPPTCFVDEQRRGPYSVWIHEHRFLAKDGGTIATDYVRYRPPGGWLVDRLFVRRDVERIFAFRSKKLLEHWTHPLE